MSEAPLTLGDRLRYFGIFVLCVVGFAISQFAAGFIATRLIDPKAQTLALDAIFRPLGLGIMLLIFGGMAKLFDRSQGNLLDSQGLGFGRRWQRELLLGILLGAGSIVIAVAAIVILGQYHAEVIGGPRLLLRLAVIFWIGVTAAAMEEVAFRGYPFQNLIRAIGPWAASIGLALLFGAIHLNNPHSSAIGFVNTALVSLLLALAYIRTQYLWLPIGFHLAWNLTLGTAFGLPVSGVDLFAVAVKAKAEGPVLLTGGDYGIEASLTGTIVILLGIIALYLLTPTKKLPSDEPSVPV
ncbi:MAG TPA: CPBP family intramembrane glutamic endopeptidase [Terriglobales bacterium]|nr:CPBP family intramembrane glutamic endopeptidase [Terriglobales bacterium]